MGDDNRHNWKKFLPIPFGFHLASAKKEYSKQHERRGKKKSWEGRRLFFAFGDFKHSQLRLEGEPSETGSASIPRNSPAI